VSRPSRRRNELAIGNGIVDGDLRKLCAGKFDFGAACGIGRAFAPLDYPGCSEKLGAMADRGNRFVGVEEVADGLDHVRIEPKIFRRPSAGNDKRIVILGTDLGERCVECEVVAAFFGVGLVAFEIVNGRCDRVAGLFPGQTACTVWPQASSV
jgi:hypothetical protein